MTSRVARAVFLCAVVLAACSPTLVTESSPTPSDTAAIGTMSASPPASSATAGSTIPATPPSTSTGDTSGFVTAAPTDAQSAWSGIRWRKLSPDDPLSLVRSVVRWQGGFVAVGPPVANDAASRTPVWTSADGRSWQPLPADVLGPDAIVLGVGETSIGLVALTLRGGKDTCDGQNEYFSCWTLGGRLQAWVTSDGTHWVTRGGPDIAIPAEYPGGGLVAPIVGAGAPGVLVVVQTPAGERGALSRDGITWETLPADTFPAGVFFSDAIEAFGSGLVAAAGSTGEDPSLAVVLSSADARHWEQHGLTSTGLAPETGTNADALVLGALGMVATGSTDDTPGKDLWWSSLDARSWRSLSAYPPLGVWTGDAEGSGLIPNGNLVGDGDRMLAYRGGNGEAAWTSLDGRSWQPLTITGARPTAGDWPLHTLILSPIGVLWIGDAPGESWFGEPITR
jgi:hypothetical protein